MPATRSVWQRALQSTVLILLCLFPLSLSSDLLKMLRFFFFFSWGTLIIFWWHKPLLPYQLKSKTMPYSSIPLLQARAIIYMNFPLKTPVSSRKHHHNSQTSRKYYQVDNLQDIYKLTVIVSFTVAYKKVCKKNVQKEFKTSPSGSKRIWEVTIQVYLKLEVFTGQNEGKRK